MLRHPMDHFDPKLDNLPQAIYLGFLAAPKHLRTALTGGKALRRRYDILMPDLARSVGLYLCRGYQFYRGDKEVEEADVIAFLLDWYRALPDDDAEACGAKSILVSGPAQKKVSAVLHAAITSQWRSVYMPKQHR